jgi:GAF domain-containing protein
LDFLSQQQTPTKIRKSSTLSSDEEAYSWDESLDNEVGNLLGGGSSSTTRPRQPIFAPNKIPRTATNTSPSKRKLDDVFDDDDKPPPYSESATTTQSSSTTAPFSSVEVSATPTPRRYNDILSAQESASHQSSDLASNILSILDRHDVVVPITARDEVVASLDQHHLKTQGIIRGRDISRMALKKKDEEIQALKARIERLETEREMDKIVISCLRDHNNK